MPESTGTAMLPHMGKHGGRRNFAAPLVVTLALAVVVTIGVGAASITPKATRTHITLREAIRTPTPPAPQPVTFTAAGDSITAWIDYNGVPQNELTWVNHAINEDLTFVGGWAKGGAQIRLIAENMTPNESDIVVVMAGTNDLGDRWGTPMAQRLQGIAEIVQKSAAPVAIISAIAPSNEHPDWAAEHNLSVRGFAVSQGWLWVDPWVSVRDLDGRYLPGLTTDGIHPVPAAQALAAPLIREAILSALR